MHSFRSFLQELIDSTDIKFNLIDENSNELFRGFDSKEVTETATFKVSLGKTQAYVCIPMVYESCKSLLKYTIENKYNEIFSIRQQLLNDILDGKEISFDVVEKNFLFLPNGCNLLLVNVDGSRYEALNVIRELYNDEDVVSIIYGDNVVLIGIFDELEEHAQSIKESIATDLYCRCCVSYSEIITDVDGLRVAYKQAKEGLMLGKKFKIKEEIFSYNKLMFEKIVYNLKDEVKNELMIKFREKFNCFDSEMIMTIEEFINCGLNISDAARKLYIHRNTLIYRLDKIYKETGFDIRNFKEATVFIIAFLVWKSLRE